MHIDDHMNSKSLFQKAILIKLLFFQVCGLSLSADEEDLIKLYVATLQSLAVGIYLTVTATLNLRASLCIIIVKKFGL